MLRTVHLHGRLGERFGKEFRLDVSSPAEAFHALVFQLPGFGQYVRERNYVVTAGRSRDREQCPALPEQALRLQLGGSTDIHLVPAPLMAGIETIIIIGLVVVIAAVSVAMILLMPKAPKPGDREEATKKESFVFDGAENVIEQGHPAPLIYGGPIRCGSVVVSSGISTADIGSTTNPPGGKSGTLDPENVTDEGGAGGGLIGVTDSVDHTADAEPSWFFDHGNIQLAGGGKGGGGSDGMQEAPNSLRSNATARVLEVISEGEIVGLVNGMKSVFLDNTQLQNDDDSFNFQGATVQQRVGLPDQDYVAGFTAAENTTDVNTDVKVSLGPVTRTIDDPDVSVARVTIRVPALYKQETDDGDINPTAVSLKISVQVDGGGFTDVYTMRISGKTNQPYDRSVDILLPPGLERNIRVTRLTADSEVSSLVNTTRWQLLTEIIEAKLSYPDSALIGLTVDARQFGNSIPVRSYEVKGLIVEVPTNYDPATRAYAGIWDGTFKRAWTNNPAWCLRDLIINRRYGLGARIGETVPDKWALYSIAQYCDELVPDFFGGMEPRYTLNTVIRTKTQAYDLIASIASNFRGWVFWGSGSIVTAMDRPEDPTALVTRSNTVDGVINYGRVTPYQRRRSAVVVWWNDPGDAYRLAPEIVERNELVRRFGRRTGDEVTAFGVTSRGHAHRLAEFILEDESPASNTVANYQVGDDHSFVAPGRIGMVADPMFTENRRGGRVRASSVSTVTIDEAYEFEAGPIYTLRAMLPDGTVSVRPIDNAPGVANVIELGGGDWLANNKPNPGSVFTIETDAVANRQFRVRQIETDKPPYAVKAVLHDPTKYERVEFDRDIETPNYIQGIGGPLQPPTDLGVFEYLLGTGTSAVPAALFSWTPAPDPRVLIFQAQAKGPEGDWFDIGDSLEPSRTVTPVVPGAWLFRVRAVDVNGQTTAWQQGSGDLDGQADTLPEVVAPGVEVNEDLFAVKIAWFAPDDYRPLRYEILYDEAGVFVDALSLGLTDSLEFPVAQPGSYWVRTWFMGFTSTAPVEVEVSGLIFSGGITPHLSNDPIMVPALPDGTVINYDGAVGEMVIYSGSTDISASFALSVPGGGNPQALDFDLTDQTYTITDGLDPGEETGTLVIRATGSGAYAGVVLDRILTVAKAKQGRQGDYRDIKFQRSNTPPATPVDDDPADWFDGVPSGSETLWMIIGLKDADGVLIGPWSTPQSISGTTPRGAYSPTETYYLNNTVTFNGGTYIAVQDNFSGQAPSGDANATAYWDVLAAPGDPGEPATPPSAFSATIDLTSGAAVNLRTIANANGYTGLSDATITFRVPNGVTIRGLSGSGKGIDTGAWPAAYTIALDLVVQNGGIVDGGGGNGGAGGGFGGLSGHAGNAGGDAIYCQVDIDVTIDVGGTVRGSGAGGAGGAGNKHFVSGEWLWNGGGGGGGGFPNGAAGQGGSGDSSDGDDGSVGTPAGGGAGGAGGGGGAGAGSAGGNAGTSGFAVRKNGFTVPVTNNGTMTGSAA